MLLSARNPIANQWWMLLVMGVVYFALYFGIFYFLIGKFNMKTPGREPEDTIDADAGAALADSSDMVAVAAQIIVGLGGAENIDTIDHCVTRLRVTTKDYTKVKEALIKKAGVAGVIRPSQKSVQVVVGPQVQFVYDEAVRQLKAGTVSSPVEKG